jgi:phage shock protein E
MKLILLGAGACALLLTLLVSCKGDKKVTSSMIRQAIILDVRTKGEYDSGHIAGAVNIPLSKLRTVPLDFDTDRVLITYCSHGLRSKKAAAILKSRGYARTYDGGAMSALQQKMGNN